MVLTSNRAVDEWLGLFDDPILGIQDTRHRIGRVAFGGDALVPVVIGIGRVLHLDGFQPGIFPRRLVKMAVDADVSFHKSLASGGGSLRGDLILAFDEAEQGERPRLQVVFRFAEQPARPANHSFARIQYQLPLLMRS